MQAISPLARLTRYRRILLIRQVGGDALQHLDGKLARRILSQLDAHPISSIVALRVLFKTLPALNYARAMSGVRMRAYLFATLLGLPLPNALYCLFLIFWRSFYN